MWAAIEADFDREYRCDLSAPGLLRSKSWRWFLVRLRNLSPDAAVRAHAQQARKASGGDQRAVTDAFNRAANRRK